MKLRESKIVNFGKLNKQDMKFSDGINLIYGENESGKSTLHTFLRSILFDVERSRGRGAATDDFHRCEPWDNPGTYGGSLTFESGGRTFLLKRRFDRNRNNSSLVCLDDGEELAIENGDLEVLLGSVSPAVYDNTLSIRQLQAAPGSSLANEMQNYATNYYASGEGDLDIDAALEMLKQEKKSLEQRQKQRQEKRRSQKEHIEQEATFVWRELHKSARHQEDLEEELKERKEQINDMFVEPEPKEEEKRWRVYPIILLEAILVIALMIVLIPKPYNFLAVIIVILLAATYTWNRLKVGKKPEMTESEKILSELSKHEEGVPLEQLVWEIERSKNDVLEKQMQYNNLREQLEEIDVIDEEDEQLKMQIEAIDLASDRIEVLSKSMQKQMILKLNARMSQIMKELTQGRYEKVYVSSDLKLSVYSGKRMIPLYQLSKGTIEQVYLSFRMAAAEMLTGEDWPIILDDAFVCYDDKRLKNTLQWLVKEGRQVLLFSCQKREMELLRDMGVSVNIINL